MDKVYTEAQLMTKYQQLSAEKKIKIFEKYLGLGKYPAAKRCLIFMMGYRDAGYDEKTRIIRFVKKKKSEKNA